jgi:hypothetical protein
MARAGSNRTVVCVGQGPVIREFVPWQGADLEVTSHRVLEICERYGIRPTVERHYGTEGALAVTAVGEALLAAQPGDSLSYIEHARDAVLRFDIIGLGSGPFDRLRHLGYAAEGFNGGEKPIGVKADRFYNRRAQSYWELRDLLDARQLALPPSYRDQLIRELCAIGWTTTGDRRIQIESKALIKAKLGGASPDFADALAMCVCPDGAIRFGGDCTGPVAF